MAKKGFANGKGGTHSKYRDDDSELRPWERRLTRVEERTIRQRYGWARTDLMHVVELVHSRPLAKMSPVSSRNQSRVYQNELPHEYLEWDEIAELANHAPVMSGFKPPPAP